MVKVIKSKIEQLIRLVYINSVSIKNDSVLVMEFPKSGGTWLGQLIAGYLEVPFPRNRIPSRKRILYHGHYYPKNRITKNRKIVLLVRDGRDVLVSLYHHQLMWNPKNKENPSKINYYRDTLGFEDYDDVQGNLSAFMEYAYTHKPSKFRHFLFYGNWYQFNSAWLDQQERSDNIYMVKYEDLLTDTAGTMKKLLTEFLEVEQLDEDRLNSIVQQFSFENQTKRKQGEEDKASFLRKGVSGDWKNYFGPKEKQQFKDYTGDMLIRLGYEKDSNW